MVIGRVPNGWKVSASPEKFAALSGRIWTAKKAESRLQNQLKSDTEPQSLDTGAPTKSASVLPT